MQVTSPPPTFLREASNPLRWSILSALSQGDLRVRELCGVTGEPQNLVSYHLGRLRSARLVSMRRSSADGRDSYYRIDLGRCGELLSEAGAALHPALGGGSARAVVSGVRTGPARVLFLCTGNSARSQMAEAMLRTRAPFPVEVFSAGSRPKPLHAEAVRAMAARAIDILAQRPKHFEEFAASEFDFVVTLCDRVREVCPEFPGQPGVLHWSMPDPSTEGTAEAFERTAEELETRIAYFITFIENAREGQEVA